jgi:hypothetical protein
VHGTHVLPLHTKLAQSVYTLHPLPLGQPPQVPPQSVPVSLPFIMLSLQLAA